MAQYRMTVEIDRANDPARDIITNTLYFDTDLGVSEVEGLADDLRDIYADINIGLLATGYRVRVKAYEDPGNPPGRSARLRHGLRGWLRGRRQRPPATSPSASPTSPAATPRAGAAASTSGPGPRP